jgi:hypothetical protein
MFLIPISRFWSTPFSYPELSVLIETTGIGWQQSDPSPSPMRAELPRRANGRIPSTGSFPSTAVEGACYGGRALT